MILISVCLVTPESTYHFTLHLGQQAPSPSIPEYQALYSELLCQFQCEMRQQTSSRQGCIPGQRTKKDLGQLSQHRIEPGVVERDVIVGQLVQHGADQPRVVKEDVLVAEGAQADTDVDGAAPTAPVIDPKL